MEVEFGFITRMLQEQSRPQNPSASLGSLHLKLIKERIRQIMMQSPSWIALAGQVDFPSVVLARNNDCRRALRWRAGESGLRVQQNVEARGWERFFQAAHRDDRRRGNRK